MHHDEISQDEYDDLTFIWLCSSDLNTALHIIGTLNGERKNGQKDKSVRYYLLLSLVVTYIRPFSTNRGRELAEQEYRELRKRRRAIRGDGKCYRSHKLAKTLFVPRRLHELHDRLVVFRNKQFAHTDIGHRKPRIGNLGSVDRPLWVLASKGSDFEFLDKNCGLIEELVTAVEKKVITLRDQRLACLNPKAVP